MPLQSQPRVPGHTFEPRLNRLRARCRRRGAHRREDRPSVFRGNPVCSANVGGAASPASRGSSACGPVPSARNTPMMVQAESERYRCKTGPRSEDADHGCADLNPIRWGGGLLWMPRWTKRECLPGPSLTVSAFAIYQKKASPLLREAVHRDFGPNCCGRVGRVRLARDQPMDCRVVDRLQPGTGL